MGIPLILAAGAAIVIGILLRIAVAKQLMSRNVGAIIGVVCLDLFFFLAVVWGEPGGLFPVCFLLMVMLGSGFGLVIVFAQWKRKAAEREPPHDTFQ